MGPTPLVRHSPCKGTPNRGFHTRARLFAVDAGAWSRLISADRMVRFHRLRPRGRSSYAVLLGSSSSGERGHVRIVITAATAHPLVEALHASKRVQVGPASETRGFHTRVCEKFSLVRRGASGEAMIDSVNRASIRSFGANERWVRVPPPRLSEK
jgi:hypothetical protein